MQRVFLLHALSPLHPGTGQAVGLLDLPIARLKATGIPFLPGSSIKGVLRDAMQPDGAPEQGNGMQDEWKHFFAVFGPDPGKAEEHAGAVAVGDARLLVLPVRSFRGTFAYVTSPLLLRLALQDLRAAGRQGVLSVPAVGATSALVTPVSVLRHGGENAAKLYLEDLDLTVGPTPAEPENAASAWAEQLGTFLFGEQKQDFAERFAIVGDETMTFLWETATQVDARVRIGPAGVVEDGALWYEESLPAETVLIGLVSATMSRRRGTSFRAEEMLDAILPKAREDLQFGGKATVGRGRARLVPVM